MHRKRDTKTSTIFSVRRGGWLLWAVPFVNKNWTGYGATALLCFRECPCHQNASPGDGADLTLRNTLPQPQHAHLFQDIQKSLLWSRHKWCHASDKESGWEYLQRESLQFTVFRVRFQLSSHFNRPLILSPNNLCACHKTGESKSPGCALQPKAKAPCASAVEHAELAFVTELVAPHRGDRH